MTVDASWFWTPRDDLGAVPRRAVLHPNRILLTSPRAAATWTNRLTRRWSIERSPSSTGTYQTDLKLGRHHHLHRPIRRCSHSRPTPTWKFLSPRSAQDPTARNSRSTCGHGSGSTTPVSSPSLSPPARSRSPQPRRWRQSPGRSANPQPKATPTSRAAPRQSPVRAPAPPHPRPTTGKPNHPAATNTTGAHSKNAPAEPAPGPSPPPPTGASPGSPTPESPAAPPSTLPPTTSSTSVNTAPSSSKDPADDPHPKGIRLPSTHRPSAPNSTAHTSPAH